MHHYNTFVNFVQQIFSSINPVSAGWPLTHTAKDTGTMGYLFKVQHDWSGEFFSTDCSEGDWVDKYPKSTGKPEPSSLGVTRGFH